jgi:hypothetical protein
MKNVRILMVTVVLAWVVAACSIPDIVPQKEAKITATPTRTLKPTFTATTIPTRTSTPSRTPTPSSTPTKTPVPTDTPLPTDTPTLTPIPSSTPTSPPTATATATKKPTPRPTRRPTKVPTPRPTNTPPPPFNGSIVRGYPHCGGYAGVTGQVLHANGSPYAGVAVGVWSNVWQGRVGISEADGKFEINLSDLPPGHFQVAVVKLQTCGQLDGQTTAKDCQFLSNIITGVTVTEFCDVNRVTEINFYGP